MSDYAAHEYSMRTTLKTSSCEYCRLQQWILEFSTLIVVTWIMTVRIARIKSCTLYGWVSLTLCFVSLCFGTFDFTVNKLLLKVIKQWIFSFFLSNMVWCTMMPFGWEQRVALGHSLTGCPQAQIPVPPAHLTLPSNLSVSRPCAPILSHYLLICKSITPFRLPEMEEKRELLLLPAQRETYWRVKAS